ncbi:phenylacetate--CoA ligase family protein [Mucilaginibacter gotjawali]|uniref:Phenylacetate-coenzyme A ligase n=2 Tax=Mucilaginibacter gotjawali TaxID=1550579 RepID=A0A0X8X1Y2_9SPHI|nr:AMP-binding protein [Mucilaginibacter gotjawali]MBB3054034.1 phenylacetate-CoA ligase [Mucilaginibacter gotjawali]BAU54300.1 Phenylacetate-coenzyme A ligase [Mucilaginibacter gotjawali]
MITIFQETDRRKTDQATLMQEQKLQKLLLYLSRYSPFYKELFKKNGIDINAIQTLADLQFIPTTSKDDLQQRNDDFLCVPLEKVAEYTSTSGTLGSPVTIALTANDLDRLACNEYNSFLCADGTANDTYQLMLTLDRQFMAGIAYYSGIRQLGAGIIRLGPGVPSLQWETIKRLKPTAIVAVPSFILKLIQFAKETGIDIHSTSVKKAICIGENIRNTDFSLNILGKKITESWDIHLYSTYASTEMQTAFTECSEGRGGHYQPELLIVELLDENNKQVAPYTPGEVTITTLGVEGMPLLRYKTGDICMYDDEPCACGRTSLRLSPVMGRKKQMIKFKGTTLYPPALFDLLNEREEILDFVIEVYSNEIGLDQVLLYLLPVEESEACDHRIRAYLQARLRVSPHIKYVNAEEIQKKQFQDTSRKAVKFIDLRS